MEQFGWHYLRTNCFYSIKSGAILYVPKGTTAIYKAKSPWKSFKYIEEYESSGINAVENRAVIVQTDGQSVSVSGLKDGEVVSLYNVSGVLLSKGKAAAGVAKS